MPTGKKNLMISDQILSALMFQDGIIKPIWVTTVHH